MGEVKKLFFLKKISLQNDYNTLISIVIQLMTEINTDEFDTTLKGYSSYLQKQSIEYIEVRRAQVVDSILCRAIAILVELKYNERNNRYYNYYLAILMASCDLEDIIKTNSFQVRRQDIRHIYKKVSSRKIKKNNQCDTV